MLLLIASLIVMGLSGCSHVTINDSEFCVDLAEDGAHCEHFLSNKTRDPEKAEWDKERFGQFCMSSDDFAQWKKDLELTCNHDPNYCSYADIQQFHLMLTHVNRARRHAGLTPLR